MKLKKMTLKKYKSKIKNLNDTILDNSFYLKSDKNDKGISTNININNNLDRSFEGKKYIETINSPGKLNKKIVKIFY